MHLGVKEAEKFKVIVNYVMSSRPSGAVRGCKRHNLTYVDEMYTLMTFSI